MHWSVMVGVNSLPQLWRRLTLYAGAWPLWATTWALAGLLSVWAIVNLMVIPSSSGLANSTYDAMMRARFIAPPNDPRIVIVDIDEASLQAMSKEFGRWPWPRDTLATALQFIEKQGPAAIVWDIVFSDLDRLSPGGDAAFNNAVKASTHSHFPVVRLPPENDIHSQLTRTALPQLWLPDLPNSPAARSPAPASPTSSPSASIALIAPALPAIAASKLGYNNAYPDADGVLRRYRYIQRLPDGSRIQSLAIAAGRSAAPDIATAFTQGSHTTDALLLWPQKPNNYPRIPFFKLFMQAEGGPENSERLPSLRGKVVLIGSTAASLHDVHPTPLSPTHPGVDSLATAIDHVINGRHLAELPTWAQTLLAIFLIISMAAWTLKNGVSSLDPALLPLPATLLALSYLSLNIGHYFIDLHLAAGAALIFIALLKSWNGWRRNTWCDMPAPSAEPFSLLALHSHAPVADVGLDRLIRLIELHAPACRVLGGDATATWPSQLRWPQCLHRVCVIGPDSELTALAQHLQHHTTAITAQAPFTPIPIPANASRLDIAQLALHCVANQAA